ncbi:MAG: S8 family serine peptidase [candidate division Zixibacteria bacterium]|nr:S8 family serine peptidase [candidate division Zixibacteria bacterium]
MDHTCQSLRIGATGGHSAPYGQWVHSTPICLRFANAFDTLMIQALDSDTAVLRMVPVYSLIDTLRTPTNLVVTDEVIVAFDRERTLAVATAALEPFGLEAIHANPFNRTVFLATLVDGNEVSCVTAANTLFAEEHVRWATPNFHNATVPCSDPSDNYYPQQFWMPLIHGDSGWFVTNPYADTVSVAVIDDGVDTSGHLDLSTSRIDPGWDVAGFVSPPSPDSDPSPSPVDDSHGMRVTGILAAARNDTGLVGVDPWCRIRPI